MISNGFLTNDFLTTDVFLGVEESNAEGALSAYGSTH